MSARREIPPSTVRRGLGIIFAVAILIIVTAASGIAAPPPLGAGNEVWVDVPDTVYVEQEVEIQVYMANTGTVQAFSTTYEIYSYDGAQWDWVVQTNSEWDFQGEINIVSHVPDFRFWDYLPYRMGEWGPVDSQSAKFDISCLTFFEPWAPPGPLAHAYTIHIRPTMTGTICIDSSMIWTADEHWVYIGSEGTQRLAWNGPFCMTVVEPPLGDVDCDGAGNLGDAVYIINWIFKGGPEPCR